MTTRSNSAPLSALRCLGLPTRSHPMRNNVRTFSCEFLAAAPLAPAPAPAPAPAASIVEELPLFTPKPSSSSAAMRAFTPLDWYLTEETTPVPGSLGDDVLTLSEELSSYPGHGVGRSFSITSEARVRVRSQLDKRRFKRQVVMDSVKKKWINESSHVTEYEDVPPLTTADIF